MHNMCPLAKQFNLDRALRNFNITTGAWEGPITINETDDLSQFGTYSSTAGNGLALSSSQTRVVTVCSDDVGAAMTGDIRAFLSRVYVSVDQNSGVTLNAVRGQIKVANDKDLNHANNVVAPVQGYFEFAGTANRTLTGHVAGVRAALEEGASGTTTISASSYYAGFEATLNSTRTYTETGDMAGLIVNISGGTAVWPKGIYIDDSAATTSIELGSSTTGITFTGTTERAVDFGSMTTGTTTDGVLLRAGTGIGASGLAFGTASQRAIALYLRPTATTGTFKGMRLRSIADAASGSALNVDNLHCQASVIASKDAAVINCGFFELIFKGTNDVDWGRCLLTNVDSAAAVTISAGLVNTHIRTHTRGDETMGGVDEMLRIENEAVGGNGRQMDSFIRCMETSMSGGIKSAGYLIDGGTGTSLLATAVLRVPDDGTVCHDTDTGAGTDLQFSDFTGYLTVVVGSATRYIPLLTSKPSDLS